VVNHRLDVAIRQPIEGDGRHVRASGGGRRGGARTLTPFVGREEELGVLARRWERARAGEGRRRPSNSASPISRARCG
jgi:hypothetical protein